MVKDSFVTKTQAQALKKLGFKEPCLRRYIQIWAKSTETPTNKEGIRVFHINNSSTIGVPTIDEVIDWLRRKYNIIIYNQIEPFVDPTDTSHKSILFKFGVKKCDTNNLGWNGRRDLGTTRLNTNVYSLKREAISIALKYLKHSKNG